MRILIISFYFPPYNNIASVRVGKLARYWTKMGHQVRVVSAADQLIPTTLECPLPSSHISYTPWRNVRRPIEWLAGKRRSENVTAEAGVTAVSLKQRILKLLWIFYKTILYLPDMQIGWCSFAKRESLKVVTEFNPDVIYASSCPQTSLIVASKVSKETGIPWIAEFRDLWSDSHIYQFPEFRRSFDAWLEKRVVSTSAGMVTVSEPLARRLRAKYNIEVATITNGFDPEDMDSHTSYTPPTGLQPLRIVYTGRIAVYKEMLRIDLLFQGAKASNLGKEDLRFVFYGGLDDRNVVESWAAKSGVGSLIEFHDLVPHKDAIRVQLQADALLLMLGFGEREEEAYSGKFFEYLGAKRPILFLGSRNNVAAKWISEHSGGRVVESPEELAQALRDWVAEHRSSGLKSMDDESISEFTRENQARRAAEFIESVLHRLKSTRL